MLLFVSYEEKFMCILFLNVYTCQIFNKIQCPVHYFLFTFELIWSGDKRILSFIKKHLYIIIIFRILCNTFIVYITSLYVLKSSKEQKTITVTYIFVPIKPSNIRTDKTYMLSIVFINKFFIFKISFHTVLCYNKFQ